jgi:hypothetical protein
LIALYINNEGYYVLLSNICALANKWENFVMMEEGVEKSPGNHLTEIDGKNHNFIVGEWRPRPEVVETERMWEDISEEDKVARAHSEYR